MKLNRLLLFMQMISILPLMFFLLIYTYDSIYHIVIAIALLLLSGYNIYRYYQNLRIVKFPLLLLLIFSFLLYAFHGLGATEAPQTFETLKRGSNVTFNFEKPTPIDKVCYYIGIEKNVNFRLSSIEQSKWDHFYTYKKNFPFSFRWKCVESNITPSKVRLYVMKNEMMLGEIRFMYQNKSVPFKTDKGLLNDEQDITIDKTYFGGMFFDEIYHGRTAYEIRHGKSVYETVHPYLGKMLIIPGIELFGMTPFGWRFVNVIFGALFIFMMYYFALQLFKKRLFAFSAAFILTYSFMHFTQARVALIDTFGVFFIFVSFYYLYRFIVKQQLSLLLLSGVFFGLASAVKWSASFAALGFFMIALYLLITGYPLKKRFSGYRLILYGLLSYGIVAISVYTLSFFDIYLQGGNFQNIIDYQLNALNYHSSLVSTHAYSSPWWSWIIDFRPMCYYREIADDRFSSITVFGNPAIFWLGIVAILYLAYLFVKRRTLESSFILIAFLSLWLPYIFVGRLMFIYHFYYAVPFLILAIVYMLKDLMKQFPKYHKYYFIYLAVVALLFLAFYPVLSGYEVPKSYVDNGLIWFSGWWL